MDTRQERTGTVRNEIAPRSHEVETPSGTFRRNRRDIIHLLLKISRLEDQRVMTLTQKKRPLRTGCSQEEGYRHH